MTFDANVMTYLKDMPKRFFKSSRRKRKYAMLTAYDALTSRLLEQAGIDFILVGDSLGMVLLGYPATAVVTMAEMLHHAKAARRGAPKSFIIGDLPKKGVEKGPRQALESAKRFTGEAGMDAVKMEWGPNCLKAAELMVRHNITVQGHVGLTPQEVRDKSGFRLRGADAANARLILDQAKAFESAGAGLLLLECVPQEVGKIITENVAIPVIGIGAGPFCDGQVLVFQDLVGLFDEFKPRFVRRYAHTADVIKSAVAVYLKDVREGRFPGKPESFTMDVSEYEKLVNCLKTEPGSK